MAVPTGTGTSYLTPPDIVDPVIEVYKKDVDRTLLRENLKLTTEERSRRFENFMASAFLSEIRCKDAHIDLEKLGQLANHLPTEWPSSSEDFGDR